MAQFNELPLEVIRMILKELYVLYCTQANRSWSFSDAMRVHPIWQALGNDIIYEEIDRIVKQQQEAVPARRVQSGQFHQQKQRHLPEPTVHGLQRYSPLPRKIY